MTVEFLWGERAERTRGPKPKLSLDQIADVAIAIADAEGLAAVSMQRVAADLGYTKMSLYRYLPGKAELVALMVERALGDPPPLAGQDWRAALAEWCRLLLAGFVRHPWTLEATVGARPLGPHELGWMERALTVLAGTPLTGGERLDAMVLLVGHARMLAEQTAARYPEEQLSAGIAAVIAERGDRFPQLASAMAEAAATGGQNQAFDFGLGRILDGLDALIRSRPA
jgi:AcrR family transcriptional regulator